MIVYVYLRLYIIMSIIIIILIYGSLKIEIFSCIDFPISYSKLDLLKDGKPFK